MSNNNSGAFIGAGLVAGLALGLAIGFLYAPRSGREIRELLKDRTVEVRDRAEELAVEVKGRVGNVVENIRERAAAETVYRDIIKSNISAAEQGV
ncbi:MAG: YtxH domain-containing protein [Dehalococcoidia bacterium]|nr:YtxH domain-containing protein [Dehalococcoidia bacterium]